MIKRIILSSHKEDSNNPFYDMYIFTENRDDTIVFSINYDTNQFMISIGNTNEGLFWQNKYEINKIMEDKLISGNWYVDLIGLFEVISTSSGPLGISVHKDEDFPRIKEIFKSFMPEKKIELADKEYTNHGNGILVRSIDN